MGGGALAYHTLLKAFGGGALNLTGPEAYPVLDQRGRVAYLGGPEAEAEPVLRGGGPVAASVEEPGP